MAVLGAEPRQSGSKHSVLLPPAPAPSQYVLRACHELFHVDRAATYKVDHFFFNSILQMGKLRHREVKQLAPDTQL